MATKDKNEVTISQAANAFNDIIVNGSSGVTFDEAFKIMETAPDGLLEALSDNNYFTFEKVGETHHFVVEKTDQVITIQGKPVPVVSLRDKEGNPFVNGDKMLVSSCQKLQQLPAYIRVTFEGSVKNSVGTYKKLKVLTFPMSEAAV